MADVVNSKNTSRRQTIAAGPKSCVHQSLRPITSHKWEIGKGTGVQMASFLVKTIALETVRRFSRAKCPFIWTGLQGLQILSCPPFKWIQRWKPFGFLVNGMQMISRPLLVLSIANALADHSDGSSFRLDDDDDDDENSPSHGDPQLGSQNLSEPPSLQCTENTRICGENPQGLLSTDWINRLCQELESRGITLPERINHKELQRFYVAANGDFSTLLSSVKKTIRWRDSYRILSEEELELWSNLVFWHGLDVNHRPCLIVRLGLACVRLSSHDKPRFAQAIVSQVEYGVLHLVEGENPQITVLVDCQGLSPLRIPVKIMRHCCNILQDHFPNVLGGLIVIRLPSVVRVIAQTFLQVLKPATKQKLRIEGESYQKVLSECFQSLPSYLGGQCSCIRCSKLQGGDLCQILERGASITESVSDIVDGEDFPLAQPSDQYDMIMENNCSRTLRTAVIGILIIWVLIAFLEGIYNP
ncbi:SEC14 cytosolic factor family protein / phosphoglyceride transfer family protein [Perilla frutescens var. frutescens]|nr:SEC14 cytosolic factor family protein / phosphoglyceride transfer family protein [Perilla frutescens var. frutescens]